ncbi:DUF3433 domain-containing protein [Aspergillus alliaceus]|uniref:DUF3433 domain-containing protein n=1 Tax=Petromyces alliaceus TaxID=209559 RepID=UPI0012A5C120|nr:uncharacterized protein BDW43DRAFT_319984 [Aspergillus alliaceus]KAB8232676.1 hypothetical protein BDW43DRAFT_319984 [Aspergillus alliaceus]
MARSPSPDISLDDRTSHHNDLSASLLDPTHSRPSTLRSPSIESLRQRDDGPTPNSFNNSQRRGYSSRFREEGDETDQNIRLKNGASETTIIPSPNTPASDLLLSKIPADGRGSPPSWLPFTLKNSFLSLLSMLALALCAATTALLVRSQTNYGLGPDDGSSKILFGWRFSPTLVAVIYVQLTSMLVDDVKRLEPFARLARTKGSEASSSILQKPGAWWNALHDGLSREKNGGDSRGWVLFCATLVNVLGFLLISPLSSALLPNISFNESEYTQNRQQVPDSLMNAKTMRDLTLDPEWSSYMLTLGFEKPPSLHGPSTLLWVLYDNNLTAMVEDENVAIRAGEIQQRFFGEMLQSSLIEQGASQYIPIQGHVKTVERRVTATAGPAITLIILLFISSCLLLVAWRCSRLQHRPLNLKTDPSSSAGVTSLVVDSPRTRFSFKDLSQASDKELQGLLKGKRYYTDSKALHEMDSDQAEVANTTTGKSSPGSATKTNWVPRVLRLPTLLALLLCLVVVLVGVVVLYHFAQLSKLYKKAFVYQASISIFNKQVSTVGPFSMVPTLIAVGIGLWWGAIDNNFCRLQPFLAMAKRYRPLSESVYLSYQSSYWMWATIKAILNRHWMLVLVTLGTAVSPIFTTSMSALFQHETGVITETQMLERSLEVRQIPHIFTAVEYTVRDASNFVASVIGQLHGNLTSHWIYTAANQLTLNGSEPAWSKDGWSFVPVDLRNVSFSLPGGTESNHQGGFSQNSRINVSFSTPAIRGRIECSPYEGLSNLSSWLTVTDVSNSSLWTMNPSTGNIKTAYQLGVGFKYNSGLPSMMFPLEPSRNFTNCERCTSIFANPSSVTCCGNGTSLEADPMAAIGYWSPNSNPASWNPRTWQRNITTKWIHGHARVAVEHDVSSSSPHLLFTDIPSIAAMNCMPLVETASAEVTVDPTTGGVRAFSITDEPQTADNAFSDSFLAHRTSNRVQATVTYNATISYGMLFMTQMLTAVNVRSLYGPGRVLGWTIEDRGDNTFNIRDEANGLNLDFMSYSMYSMANKDPSALIDPTVFTRYASKTFSTFFQHFASSNISMERGSLAYQPINASLPSDLPPAVTDVTLMEDAPLADQQDVIHPISHTNRTVVVRVSKQIELLQMNAVAIWLSVSILAWLIIATVTVTIFHRQYLRRLVRNVECLGDVLVLTAGSESLVHVIQEIQAGRIAESEKSRLFARLGWFQDGDGKARWGVEMAEGDMTRPGVQWLDHGGKNIGGTDSV